jgi:4-amino-4-deoxy-L-arabinose transferase-like glycosyltransferase
VKYLILVLFTILLFINNDSLALWEQDEAAYAGFAYNMVEREQYLIPDFEWSWPHRKPPYFFG